MSDLLDGAVTIIRTKAQPISAMIQEGIDTHPLLETFFQLPNPSIKQKEKMSEVREWLNTKSESTDEMEHLRILKDIRYRLADGSLESVHKYIKLRNLSRQYETEAKALENA